MTRTRLARTAALVGVVSLGVASLTGCLPLPQAGMHASSNQPSPMRPAPYTHPDARPGPPERSPTEVAYTVGDTLVVGDDNQQARWQITIRQILADASSIASGHAPPGERLAAIEADFTLLTGPRGSDVNVDIDFAVVGANGETYATWTATNHVADADYYLLDPFSPGTTQRGQALVLVPEAEPATRWSVAVTGAASTWSIER